MLDRIRTFRTLFSKGEPAMEQCPPSSSPPGYHHPRSLNILTGSPLRKICLQQIWENCSLPTDVYQRLYIAPLSGLLARVQNVPAAEQGRWSESDGFGDLTLQFTTYAVRLAKGYMFPPGAAPEDQAAQNVMWNGVVFWSALFWHLPLLASVEGELISGKSWMPGITVPDEPFRFRFCMSKEAPAFAALAAGQLMPAGAMNWLAANPVALQNLAGAFWNHHPSMPLIGNLMQQAAEKVGSPLLTSVVPETINPSPENALLQPQIKPEETLVTEKTPGPKLASLLPAMSETQDMTIASPFELDVTGADHQPIGRDTHEKIEVEEADTEVLLSLFTQQVDPAASEELETPEMPPAPSQSNNESEGSVILSAHLEAKQPKENQKVVEGASPLRIAEDNIPLHGINKNTTKTSNAGSAGNDFSKWLSDGLKERHISINQPDSRVHAVAGFIFLKVPDIFYLYIRESDSDLTRDALQSAFEKLHIHRIRRGERFFKARLYTAPGKEGSYKPVSGYLVKATHLIRGINAPEDSRLLFFP